MKPRTNWSLALLAVLAAGGLSAHAEEPKLDPELPPDAETLKQIDALGDNSACILGDPKIIEDLGDFAKGWHNMKKTGPGGRDFTIKMAWMPDRKRAFFCGANHGSPHRFNDGWEYDLASNTWVLLYTPDYNDRGGITDYDKQTLMLQDGWLRTKKGGPGHPAHTWWGLTYDPSQRAVLWYCAWPGYRLKEKLDAIGATQDQLYKGPPMWAFHPNEKKWEPLPSTQPWPRNKFGASLQYVPELKGSLWNYDDNAWLFDAANKTWKNLTVKSAALPIETVTCYDPGRKLMIAHRGPPKEGQPRRTWHCAVQGDKVGAWEPAAEGNDDLPNGHDASSWMYFDPVGKVALLYERGSNAIWSYDPDQKKWAKNTPQGAAPKWAEKERTLAYFDTARNVFVVVGYDSVWCYRFKKAP